MDHSPVILRYFQLIFFHRNTHLISNVAFMMKLIFIRKSMNSIDDINVRRPDHVVVNCHRIISYDLSGENIFQKITVQLIGVD